MIRKTKKTVHIGIRVVLRQFNTLAPHVPQGMSLWGMFCPDGITRVAGKVADAMAANAQPKTSGQISGMRAGGEKMRRKGGVGEGAPPGQQAQDTQAPVDKSGRGVGQLGEVPAFRNNFFVWSLHLNGFFSGRAQAPHVSGSISKVQPFNLGK